ncbi:ABC transporter permease [Paraflavitalea soli]|uniref:ABC transporter permease n=1 Tax=Paraflavitalea soli TaxID=2315862 RepID=A0A3B7MK54_9BACT|nr:ABC transporter permease [Paraflavitalea soli]AXY73683.1 ABC transporter permease [Paraflavitalea soli]
MLRTVFKYVLRGLRRNVLSSVINITGFSIGIAGFLLIVSYIKYEQGYDSFYPNADRIFRVGIDFNNSNAIVKGSMVQFPVAPVLKRDHEEVEDYARVWSNYNLTIKSGDKEFWERNIYNVDPQFPAMFCKMILGNAETCLKEPGGVIISKEIAGKYFGNENPIGKNVLITKYGEHKVTGVFENRTAASHFDFEILVPMAPLASEYATQWDSHNFYTYIRLRKGVNVDEFAPKLNTTIKKYRVPRLEGKGVSEHYFLEPITGIRLYSDTLLDFKQNGHGHYLPFFILAAIIILLFATFNYFNFSSFQAIAKEKTIAMNRVLGAEKITILSIFLAESFVYILISTIIGAGIALLLFPWFADFYEMTYSVNLISSSWFWIYIGLIIVINTVVSGIYPAILSFTFKINDALRGKSSPDKAGIRVRPILSVLQYAVSCLLMVFSLVSYYQIKYMRESYLGFNKQDVVVAREPVILRDSMDHAQIYRIVRDATAQISGIKAVTYSDYVPGGQYERFDRIRLTGKPEVYDTYMNSVSPDFFDFYKIKLMAGRNFSWDLTTDFEKAVIINEKLARSLGFSPTEIVGKQISFEGRKTVIGVVSNYHQESLKKAVAPCLFFATDWPGYFSFKLTGSNVTGAIDQLHEAWKVAFPSNDFNFFFLDDYFNRNYTKDQKAWQILRLYSGLAILISILGLWGAVVHQLRNSKKRIAIYKVLGTPNKAIIWIFVKRTAYMIGLAFVIGLPIDFLLLNNWLSSFPYRIGLNISYFIIPLIVLVVIAFTTIGLQIIKVVSSNLVYALRSE